MKLNCSKSDLLQGLSAASRAVSSRATLPILLNVLLVADENGFHITGTDLEMTTRVSMRVSSVNSIIIGEYGSITVPARTFLDLVKSLYDDDIELNTDDKKLTLHIHTDHNNATIKGLDPADFPMVSVEEQLVVMTNAQELKTAIDQTAFAAASDFSRQILTGVFIEYNGNKINLVSADGFRLSHTSIIEMSRAKIDESDKFSVIVPARSMLEISKSIQKYSGNVSLSIDETGNRIKFNVQDTVIMLQLISGNFPDYDKIIPKEHATEIIVDTGALLSACKAISVFARDAADIVRLKSIASQNKLIVSARSVETGDGVSEIDAQINDDNEADDNIVEIAFSVKYLLNVLSIVGTDKVSIKLTSQSSPGLIQPVGGTDLIHVIMPMYLETPRDKVTTV